jgi:hypothetical protein
LNYSELQSVIADFANRQDLASQIPTFIQLTEARLNRDIRHWRQEKRAAADVVGERFPLPCDWVETIKVKADGRPLRLADAFMVDAVDHEHHRPSAGNLYYRHTGDQFELFPAQDKPVRFEVEYVAKVPPLSDSEPTNWLLEEFPDVYIFGAMLQVAPFLHDDQRLPLWTQAYGEAVSAANISSDKAKYSGSALRMQRHGVPSYDRRFHH